jgi:hypothetical protein
MAEPFTQKENAHQHFIFISEAFSYALKGVFFQMLNSKGVEPILKIQ